MVGRSAARTSMTAWVASSALKPSEQEEEVMVESLSKTILF